MQNFSVLEQLGVNQPEPIDLPKLAAIVTTQSPLITTQPES